MDWDIEDLTRRHEQIFRRGDSEAASRPNVIDSFDEPFFERARGFRKAADVVIDKMVEDHNAYSEEMLPAALQLYRQAIELHLKSMRQIMAREIPKIYSAGKGHDLIQLWKPIGEFMRSIGFVFDNGALHHRVEHLVKEFSDEDNSGDRFRYPDSKNPAAAIGLWTNFEALKKSMWEIDLLNFGFSELVTSREFFQLSLHARDQ